MPALGTMKHRMVLSIDSPCVAWNKCLFPYRNYKSPSIADNPDFLNSCPASRAKKERTRRSRERWAKDVSPSV